MVKIRSKLPVIIALFVVAACGGALAARQAAKGVFVDRDGNKHNWRISESQTLMWEDEAYIPVGAVFTSAYLSHQTDDDWRKDVKTLDAIKTAGITDVLVKGPGPATGFPQAAWQKLLDYLEEQGYAYGIELNDGPTTKATGLVICPRKYKIPKAEAGQMTVNIPRAQGGFYVSVDPELGEPVDSGYLRVGDGGVTFKLNHQQGQARTLLLFPTGEIPTGRGSMPDLWQGADEYRDRLIEFASGIKFGAGFRFFYSPLMSGVVPTGDYANAIPTSQSFRVDFEGWLSLKYENPEALYTAWAIAGHRENASFEQAARLVPLWWDGKGVSFAFDRATDTYMSVDVPYSGLWKDVLDFRNLSIQQSMNSVAEALQRSADVPVVFEADGYHSIYANSRDDRGFEGLSVVVSSASDADTATGGEAYSLTLEAARTTWFVGIASPGADVVETPLILARLKELGAKGFYCRVPADDVGLTSLSEFGKGIDTADADYAPEVLFYPRNSLSGARVKKLDQKTWWLPTFRRGGMVQFGHNIFGYSLTGDMRYPTETLPAATGDRPTVSGDGVALWLNKGSMTVEIKLRGRQFSISEASKSAAQFAPKKDLLTLQLSETPVVIYGLPTERFFPTEIAQLEIDELESAAAVAGKSGVNVSGYAATIEKARIQLEEDLPLLAYETAASKLDALAAIVSQHVWLEGESARDHGFDGATALAGCSGAQYLKLSTVDPPPSGAYTASYIFTAPKEGSYDFWLAAIPPGRPGASELQYSLDRTAWQAVTPSSEAAPHAGTIAWFKVGSVNLTTGQHTLTLQVSKPGPNGVYGAAIDALLLTKEPFTPNGTEKPSIGLVPVKKNKR